MWRCASLTFAWSKWLEGLCGSLYGLAMKTLTALLAIGVALRATMVSRYNPSNGYDFISHWKYLEWLEHHWALPDAGYSRVTYNPPLYYYGVAALRRFIDLLESTQSLRAAQRDLDTRLVGVAAHAMADRAGLSLDLPEVQMAAQAILGLWRIQFGALRRYTAEGMTVASGLHEQVTADVGRAARLLESGLWTFSSAAAAAGWPATGHIVGKKFSHGAQENLICPSGRR